jgi:hypothetical protein
MLTDMSTAAIAAQYLLMCVSFRSNYWALSLAHSAMCSIVERNTCSLPCLTTARSSYVPGAS